MADSSGKAVRTRHKGTLARHSAPPSLTRVSSPPPSPRFPHFLPPPSIPYSLSLCLPPRPRWPPSIRTRFDSRSTNAPSSSSHSLPPRALSAPYPISRRHCSLAPLAHGPQRRRRPRRAAAGRLRAGGYSESTIRPRSPPPRKSSEGAGERRCFGAAIAAPSRVAAAQHRSRGPGAAAQRYSITVSRWKIECGTASVRFAMASVLEINRPVEGDLDCQPVRVQAITDDVGARDE